MADTLIRHNPPRGWHEQADGSLVCPHRDLSVCPTCAEQTPEAVDVLGAHFWMATAEERAAFAADTAPPTNPEQPADEAMARRMADVIVRLVRADKASDPLTFGRIGSWEELHEVTDANMYADEAATECGLEWTPADYPTLNLAVELAIPQLFPPAPKVGERFRSTTSFGWKADGVKGQQVFVTVSRVVSVDARGFRYETVEVESETGRPPFANAHGAPMGGSMMTVATAHYVEQGRMEWLDR